MHACNMAAGLCGRHAPALMGRGGVKSGVLHRWAVLSTPNQSNAVLLGALSVTCWQTQRTRWRGSAALDAACTAEAPAAAGAHVSWLLVRGYRRVSAPVEQVVGLTRASTAAHGLRTPGGIRSVGCSSAQTSSGAYNRWGALRWQYVQATACFVQHGHNHVRDRQRGIESKCVRSEPWIALCVQGGRRGGLGYFGGGGRGAPHRPHMVRLACRVCASRMSQQHDNESSTALTRATRVQALML